MALRLFILLLCLFPQIVCGQTELLKESFETDDTSKFDANSFSDGESDYFLRLSNGSGPTGWPRDFTNMDGGYFWGGEDLASLANPINGTPTTGEGFIVLNSLDISSYSSVEIKVLLAAVSGLTDGESESFEQSHGDGFNIQYAFDGNIAAPGDLNVHTGTYITIGSFRGDAVINGYVSDLFQDTDLDGYGDGTRLTEEFREFSFTFSTYGSDNVSLRINVTADTGSEELAVDNIRIIGHGSTLPATAPVVVTSDATSITTTSATLGGNVIASGGATIIERGIVYSSTDLDPKIGDTGVTKDDNGAATGGFNETFSPLSSSTTYYFRAYGINSVGVSYGNVKSFATSPVITEGTLLLQESFEGDDTYYDANIYNDGVSDYFTVLSNATATSFNNPFTNVDGTKFFAGEDLSNPDNPFGDGENGYLVIGNSAISSYETVQLKILLAAVSGLTEGESESFEQSHGDGFDIQYAFDGNIAPAGNNNVRLGTYTTIASFRGNGGTMAQTSDLFEDTNFDGVGDGVRLTEAFQDFFLSFPTSGASNVSIRIIYRADTGSEELCVDNVRIYGFNSGGNLPSVTTVSALSISFNSATLGGIVANDGGAFVSERGVVYALTNAPPEIGGNGVIKKSNGSGTGTYSDSIGSLSQGTTYYFRAYAINSVGTNYGSVEEFETDGRCGDVSGDDDVDLEDLILALQTITGKSINPNIHADCDEDEKIGMTEALIIIDEIN